MLNKNVEKVLLNQIEKEAYSSNFYLAMAVWAETSGFQGIADWLYAQAEEERVHMLKFIKYVNRITSYNVCYTKLLRVQTCQ